MIYDRTSDFINASRWISALAVLAAHVRQLIMVDYQYVQHPNIVIKILYFSTQLGHEAVMVFFVLSGYLVGGLSVLNLLKKRFDVRDYAIHRTARIYIAFFPAVLLLGLLDIIGGFLFPETGLYTRSLHLASLDHAPTALSPTDFLGNLVMLQTIAVPTLGSNGPLWSLANEWWYYVLFGVAMWGLTTRAVLGRLTAILLLFALAAMLPGLMLLGGLIWLLGAATAIWADRGLWAPPLPVAALVALVTMVGARATHLSNIDPLIGPWRPAVDIIVGLAYAQLLLSFHRPGSGLRWANLHRRLASFSYSVYLIHFPLMLFAVAAFSSIAGLRFQLQPSVSSGVYVASILAMLLVAGWAFSQVTERYTQTLRRWLAARLLRFPVKSKTRIVR